jgi:GNAT superfamily N-acetyltransferase
LILDRHQNWDFIREPLSRGVDYRALFEADALEDEELSSWIATFSDWGQKIRIVDRLPLKMQAFDDQAVLLSMQDPVGGSPSFTALAIRHPGIVEMMRLAFEVLWDSGEPVAAQGAVSAALDHSRKNAQRETSVVFRKGVLPGCIGRVVELHGIYYSREWDAGAEFEALMARELCDFCDSYDPERDLMLTAEVGGRVVGSIVIQAQAEPDDAWARLRWFIVDETCHGRGIGRELLERALSFCRERAFPGIYLWTVTNLPQSFHLYQSVGFSVVEEIADQRYSVPRVSLRLELPLIEPDTLAETGPTAVACEG